MRSDRTRECIRKKRLFTFLSWFLCFGVAVALFAYGFATKWNVGGDETMAHIKALLITGVIALLPVSILSLLVKDKLKPTIRMINVILAAYLVANWFMYVIGALMLFDTYVLSWLVQKYKTATIANKEIDKRYESKRV